MSNFAATFANEIRRLQPGSDHDLLAAFVDQNSDEAFRALVQRHGPMVWRVCRNVLAHDGDAEDAFQATFLVLARRARSVNAETLAAWLHATARRVALKARTTRARRLRRESQAKTGEAPSPVAELSAREMMAVLDEEVSRVPSAYRLPLLLCFWQGLTQDEAAQRLGWSAGMVKGRLERGRKRLAARLARRGIAPAALLTATVAVPEELSAKAIASISSSTVPVAVAQLAAGASSSRVPRFIALAIVLLGAGALGVGAMNLRPERTPDPQPPAEKKPPVKQDDGKEALPAGAVARLGSAGMRGGAPIKFLAYSPDGKQIAAWDDEYGMSNRFTVWDAAAGRRLRQLSLIGGEVRAMAWTSAGAIAILGPNTQQRATGEAIVWDFADESKDAPRFGGPQAPNPPPTATIYHRFGISPNGKRLAGAWKGPKGTVVEVREIERGKPVKDLKLVRELAPADGDCDGLAFTPDGAALVATYRVGGGSKDKSTDTAYLWDLKTGDARKGALPGTNYSRYSAGIAIRPDGKEVAFATDIGPARVWEVASWRERLTLEDPGTTSDKPRGSSGVMYSADGKFLFGLGWDNSVQIWDAESGKRLRATAGHSSVPIAAAASPDGRRVATAGHDWQVRIWDAVTSQEQSADQGHRGWIMGIAFSSNGRTIATASNDGTLRTWDAASSNLLRRIDAGGRASGAAFTPDGRAILSSVEGKLKMWDAASGRPATLPGGLADAVASHFTFTADGRTLVTVHEAKGTIREWPTGRAARTFDLRPAQLPWSTRCESLAVSADGKTIAVHTGDHREELRDGRRFGFGKGGYVDLYRLADGSHIRQLVAEQGGFRRIAFTPDSRHVIVSGGSVREKHGIHFVDVETSEVRQSIDASGDLQSLGVSPDGRRVAIGFGQSGGAVVYEGATAMKRNSLSGGHQGGVWSIAFSPDGNRVVTGGMDGIGVIWDVSLSASRNGGAPDAAAVQRAWGDLKKSVERPSHGVFKSREATETYQRISREVNDALATLAASPKPAVELMARELKPSDDGADQLRQTRALELLERLATPEARAVLKSLAEGTPEARLTREAKAVFARLSR